MTTLPFADLPFADMITIIEDRSAALRAAAAEAGLEGRVPGCPDWTVDDLVTHLGVVHRFWAAAVSAGPAAGPPGDDQLPGTAPSGDLLTWSAAATEQLVRALASAGPDRPCWTWWRSTAAPATSGAIARHQVQEAGVHAFDAQEAAGHPRPLPSAVAGDGIGEFVTVGMAALGAWPHQGGTVALAPDDGTTWLVTLTPDGAAAVPAGPQDGSAAPDTRIRGTGSDIVLALYGRQARRGLTIEGDRDLATRLLTWGGTQ
jgi:uncharacterized protein (TIGR03083 family)